MAALILAIDESTVRMRRHEALVAGGLAVIIVHEHLHLAFAELFSMVAMKMWEAHMGAQYLFMSAFSFYTISVHAMAVDTLYQTLGIGGFHDYFAAAEQEVRDEYQAFARERLRKERLGR